MSSLATLRDTFEDAKEHFLDVLFDEFPGLTEYHWHRACSHINGENTRRNDDTSQDEALAASVALRNAWDDYITKLHVFYRARDGEHGFLGGKVI